MLTFAKRFGVTAVAGLFVLTTAGWAPAQVFRPGVGGDVRPVGVGAFGGGLNPVAGLVVNPGAAFNPYAGGAAFTSRPLDSFGGGYGGSPYGYASLADPWGGFLRGGADVINAQARFMVSQQEALLMKESVRQAKVETRRRIFDEWLYERANTPTLQDELERRRREEVRRSLSGPPVTEIWSSKALNDLLDSLRDPKYRTVEGPPISVDEDLLKRINVGPQGMGGGNFGLLKNEGRLGWPSALATPETADLRSKIDTWVVEAKNQASTGRVDPQLLKDFRAGVDALQSSLTRNVHDVPFSQYTEAKRFLSNLDDSVRVLGSPAAANYVNGKYTLRGRTVPEVLKYMNDNGLVFVPAVTGDEAAYSALYRWLVAYHNASSALVAER